MPELFRPDEALVRIAFMLPYIPLGAFAFRRLLPRLPLSAQLVATAFFVLQTLMIGLSLAIRPSSPFEIWFWDLNLEWNLLSAIASAQLMLVAGIALFAAWRSPRQPSLLRLYLLGAGLLFAFFALDEAIAIHEAYRILEVVYALLAPIVVALTALVALRSPPRYRIWHACFVAGLVIAGIAEIGLEQLQHLRICGNLGPVMLSQCLLPYYLEEPLGFLGIWLSLVAVLGHMSANQRRARFAFPLAVLAILALWSAFLSLVSPVRAAHPPAWATPTAIVYESGLEIVGYQLDENGRNASIIVYFPLGLPPADLGYSMHIIDSATQESLAGHDAHFKKKHKVSKKKHDYKPLFRQIPETAMLADLPANRALKLVLSLWRERDGEYLREPIVLSDRPLLSEAQVVLAEFVLPSAAVAATAPPLAQFEGGFLLAAADMPAQAEAGELLPIAFAWRADAAGAVDAIQFLHLGHEASGEWFVYDQPPLGPRLPTRLWYKGLADSEDWQVPLPAELAPGAYHVFAGLYRATDKERLPAFDPDGAPWLDNRVALGTIVID